MRRRERRGGEGKERKERREGQMWGTGGRERNLKHFVEILLRWYECCTDVVTRTDLVFHPCSSQTLSSRHCH